MTRAFAEIAFTPSVKTAQIRHGSRRMNERFERFGEHEDVLTDLEREFIAERERTVADLRRPCRPGA